MYFKIAHSIGIVSRKSEANVMVKNTLDVCLGGVTFWLFGYGFIFGPNSGEGVNKFSGTGTWGVEVDVENDAATYTKMFFHLSFSTAATTIVSGKTKKNSLLTLFQNTFYYICFSVCWLLPQQGLDELCRKLLNYEITKVKRKTLTFFIELRVSCISTRQV